jgi:hypothetical protein
MFGGTPTVSDIAMVIFFNCNVALHSKHDKRERYLN